MKISTISLKTQNNKKSKAVQYAAAVLFWIAVWYVVSIKINKSVILVSPTEVVEALLSLVRKTAFWYTIANSFASIAGGFLIAVISGIILACAASALPFLRILLSPLTSVMKSTPVASFVILVLLWISSSRLAILISFLMVFPVIYTNLLNGIMNVDKRLEEMAEVFHISRIKRILYIYLPDVMPFFVSACTVSLGLCWKSGVAAEVIGQPENSIGEKLYKSKLYLETADLFAWTVVIILISYLFEKLFLFALNKLWKAIERSCSK